MADENRTPAYAVPLLSVDDILEFFNTKLMLQVKKTDINPGNAEKLKDVYLVILDIIHQNSSVVVFQQRFKDLGEAQDEMEDSLIAVNIYSLLKTILARMNYHDIFPADIYIPNFKRTQQILSHLINFVSFVTSLRENSKGTLREKFNSLSARKAELIAEAPNLQRKMNDVATEIVQLREEGDFFYKRQVAIRSEMKEDMAKKDAVQRVISEKKAQRTKLVQENKVLAEVLDDLKEQNIKLAEKVVDSPEQLVKIAESRKQTIALSKAEIVKTKKRLNDAVEHARNYNMWQTRVLALLKNATAIKTEMAFAIKAKHGDLDVMEGKKQALRENIIDTEALLENLVASLKKLREKDGNLKHQHNVKKNRLKSQLKEAEMSKKHMIRNVTEMEIALTGANEEYNQLIVRMKQAKADLKTSDQRSKNHLETMAALDVYHNILFTYLADLEQTIDRLASPKLYETILKEVENALDSDNKNGM